MQPITSGPDITCWGDSLTYGTGSKHATLPHVLAFLSQRKVWNAGSPGEDSVTVCARSGANPFVCRVAQGMIPACGPVTINFEKIDGVAPAPFVQSSAAPGSSFSGFLAGVLGTITRNFGVYEFTRQSAGPLVRCPDPIPFYLNWSLARRDDIWCIWMGQNRQNDSRTIADAHMMIRYMNPIRKRWVLLVRPSSTEDVDARYVAEFGRHCILVRKHLIESGLNEAGIKPTRQDIEDIENGTVPRSLRADTIHGNSAYYSSVARLVYERLCGFGWM